MNIIGLKIQNQENGKFGGFAVYSDGIEKKFVESASTRGEVIELYKQHVGEAA